MFAAHLAPSAAGRARAWAAGVSARVRERSAALAVEPDVAAARAAGPGWGDNLASSAVTTVRALQVLLVVCGVVMSAVGITQRILCRPWAMNFMGGIACLAFAPVADAFFIACRAG